MEKSKALNSNLEIQSFSFTVKDYSSRKRWKISNELLGIVFCEEKHSNGDTL